MADRTPEQVVGELLQQAQASADFARTQLESARDEATAREKAVEDADQLVQEYTATLTALRPAPSQAE